MHEYEIILYWSNEDQAFIVDAPELSGCMAHGDDQETALPTGRKRVGSVRKSYACARLRSGGGSGTTDRRHGRPSPLY